MPSTGPTMANSASRTRSEVGRVARPGGAPRCGGRGGCRRRSSRVQQPRQGVEAVAARRRAAGACSGRSRRGSSRSARLARWRASASSRRSRRQAGEAQVGRPGLADARGCCPRRGSRGRARPGGSRRSSGSGPRAGGRPPRSRARRTAGTGPGRSPRPTRPRSWWSWARPKRSAPSITITVALGTSMPTSTTVVATSRSVRPSAKRGHGGALLVGALRAVGEPDRERRERARRAGARPRWWPRGPRRPRPPRPAGRSRRPGGRRAARRAPPRTPPRGPRRGSSASRPAPAPAGGRGSSRRVRSP